MRAGTADLIEFNERIFATRAETLLAETEIEIDLHWRQNRLANRIMYKYKFPDNWLDICRELDYRSKFGIWRFDDERMWDKAKHDVEKEKKWEKKRILTSASASMLFTQFCECGAVFQGENGDKVRTEYIVHKIDCCNTVTGKEENHDKE